MRTMGRVGFAMILFAVMLFLMVLGFSVAHAATPPTVYTHIQLTWTAPTTGCTSPPPTACDNIALTPAIIAYDVFASLTPLTSFTGAPTMSTDGVTLKANLYPSAPQGSTWYLYVRARNGALGDLPHTGWPTQAVTVTAGTVVPSDTTPAAPGSPAATISYTTTPPS